MAHDTTNHTTHDDAPAAAHGADHAHGAEPGDDHHPQWSTYWKVALILGLITVVEVWIYYTPFKDSKLFVPSLLIMSAAKFAIVVMFYMHLKYDHKLFRVLFTGPLLIAIGTLFGLMFLFGKFALHLGG